MLRTLPSASHKDINFYRSWMKEKRPVASAEARFLDDECDLVSLGASHTDPEIAVDKNVSPAPPAADDGHRTSLHSAIGIPCAAILLPLIAFSMVSEFMGRLAVVTVITGAIAANCRTDLDIFINSQNGWKYATM